MASLYLGWAGRKVPSGILSVLVLMLICGVAGAADSSQPSLAAPWWLRIVGTILGSTLVIYGLFTVQSDQKQYENYLVRWWIWVEERRERGLRWQTAFLQVVTTVTSTAFDRVFGPRIVSLEAAGASIALSMGAYTSVLLFLMRGDLTTKAGWKFEVLYGGFALVFMFIGLARIQIWSYQTGQQITLDSEAGDVNATVMGLVDKMHRRQASKRTREALRAKAKAGNVACSKVYGYNNVGGKRMVNEAEAQLVRRIFELAATQGLLKTAREVGRKVTTVRGMLFNRIYRGEDIYGRTRWIDKGGTKVKTATPESEWIRVDVPAIVTQAQWDAAHKRMAQTRLRHPGVKRDAKTGHLQGRVAVDTGLDSKHLLSGFLRCGSCGGGMTLSCVSHKGGKVWMAWFCTRRYKQGASMLDGCKGSVPYEAIASAVQSALDPKAIEREIMAYLSTIAAPGPEDQRDRIAADLAKFEREADNLANAIGLGGDMPVLVAKLKAATARVEGLRASLAAQETLADHWAELDPEDLAEALRLSRDGSPDLTADRKVLRALGVTITVDHALKEAVIDGNLGQIVASRLSSNAQNLWEGSG